MRAALYLRVSTKKQEIDSQKRQVLDLCKKNGWQIVAEYAEKVSGTRADRAELSRLFQDAEAKRFDLVIFWSLDRLSREGPLRTMLRLERLTRAGVAFHSYCEPFLDSVTGAGELLVPILAWIAKQEVAHHRERIQAGIERARNEGTRSGKAIGRPLRRIPAETLLNIIARRKNDHCSWAELSAEFKIPPSTIRAAFEKERT